MKDIAKFAGTTLLLLLTLTLVSLVFIQSFMGDYEWLNIALTVVYSLAVLAAMVYDGLQRGTQDCKYAALMERQQRATRSPRRSARACTARQRAGPRGSSAWRRFC